MLLFIAVYVACANSYLLDVKCLFKVYFMTGPLQCLQDVYQCLMLNESFRWNLCTLLGTISTLPSQSFDLLEAFLNTSCSFVNDYTYRNLGNFQVDFCE